MQVKLKEGDVFTYRLKDEVTYEESVVGDVQFTDYANGYVQKGLWELLTVNGKKVTAEGSRFTYNLEDATTLANGVDKNKSEVEDTWTDKHYDHYYYPTERELKEGKIKFDAYKVAKVWKIGRKDDSGCLWHTFKLFPRWGEKNNIEREIKALYNQAKCLAEIYDVDLK